MVEGHYERRSRRYWNDDGAQDGGILARDQFEAVRRLLPDYLWGLFRATVLRGLAGPERVVPTPPRQVGVAARKRRRPGCIPIERGDDLTEAWFAEQITLITQTIARVWP